MQITAEQRRHAQDLLDFIDASPSPWHVVDTLAQRLATAGYTPLDERDRWRLAAGGRHYIIRSGSSLIAFRVGSAAPADAGFRIIGAHTDSPGLRIKPNAAHGAEHLLRLGVEIYGGPILATFADRDLSLAGRVCRRGSAGIETHLIRFEQPLVRLPNLAIHMNRQVNEDGLKFNKQTELPLMLAQLDQALPPGQQFLNLLAEAVSCPPGDILSFELNVYDTQPGVFWGAAGEFLADSQIDNLASCHAALTALLETGPGESTAICACFDHEEVGSESQQGAAGSFLGDVLERLSHRHPPDPSDPHRALARSLMISADAAHAHHPNFPNAYEPWHAIQVNAGPAVKLNVNQRYATHGPAAAQFMELCRLAGIPGQTYVHHTGLGCGSTIGPMTAARLGIPVIDCGPPMWAMHSARESAGVLDQGWFAKLLKGFLNMAQVS